MKIELTKASSRGQVVIPKEIRERIGIQEGTPFAVSLISGIVFMKKLDIEKEFEKLHRWGTKLAKNKNWKETEVNQIIHRVRNPKK